MILGPSVDLAIENEHFLSRRTHRQGKTADLGVVVVGPLSVLWIGQTVDVFAGEYAVPVWTACYRGGLFWSIFEAKVGQSTCL